LNHFTVPVAIARCPLLEFRWYRHASRNPTGHAHCRSRGRRDDIVENLSDAERLPGTPSYAAFDRPKAAPMRRLCYLDQRLWAALRAISFRLFAESPLGRAYPPIRPRATAAGFLPGPPRSEPRPRRRLSAPPRWRRHVCRVADVHRVVPWADGLLEVPSGKHNIAGACAIKGPRQWRCSPNTSTTPTSLSAWPPAKKTPSSRRNLKSRRRHTGNWQSSAPRNTVILCRQRRSRHNQSETLPPTRPFLAGQAQPGGDHRRVASHGKCARHAEPQVDWR